MHSSSKLCLTPPVKGESKVWLNYIAYAQRILGETDDDIWSHPSQFLALYSKAQQLLNSDVLSIPIIDFYKIYLKNNPEIIYQWEGKKTTFALRKILNLEAPRINLIEVLEGIKNLYGDHYPITIAVPSPHHWLYWLKEVQNFDGDLQVRESELDGASMYVADYLRNFSKSGIAGIVLDESVPFTNQEIKISELYQSIFNSASHYQWALGILLKDDTTREKFEEEILLIKEKIDFFLFDGKSNYTSKVIKEGEVVHFSGIDQEAGLEKSNLLTPVRGWVYGTVQENANPELVLQWLGEFRS
ncbi:hypothetical protein [Neobacillus niacini]|uniref:hypothetical protein n=1 Tax=Neobacillus niacini TaxID=86668 RepID=UPI0021CB1A7D|nr:hypothetical protein [Neobacillus niacini]MCM3766217.1 hypothetical protein [Neobacillus niacini]